MIDGQITFTGTNAADVASTLGLYVQPHPTQSAIVLFAYSGASDSLGVAGAGQVITVSGNKLSITGTATPGPPPGGGGGGGPAFVSEDRVKTLLGDYVTPKSAQTFTSGEQAQARQNIGAIDAPTAQGIALVQTLVFGS